LAAQSALLWHSHTLVPPLQVPDLQVSLFVHGLASSQTLPSVLGTAMHLPDLGSQVSKGHGSALTLGQTTAVAGLGLHTGLAPPLSQYQPPLHRSSSSLAAQSAFFSHSHRLAPP